MIDNKYDLAIIGSGPCGYVSAIRAAQLGLKTCVFEEHKIGGVCLNYGCVPAKVLINTAGILYDFKRASEFGINIKDWELDFSKVQAKKEAVINKLASGIELLFKSKSLNLIKEKAEITSLNHIRTNSLEVFASNILIASGSEPYEMPELRFDNKFILSSTDILALPKVPESIVILGGGVIGCEFASMLNIFGSNVTIVEKMGQILPNEDEEIARKIEIIFRKRGIKVMKNTTLAGIERRDEKVKTIFSNGENVEAERILACLGRKPNYKGLGLENIGVEFDNKGIKVDRFFRTNIQNIYAAGDVKGGFLLAHVASKEGICAVEAIHGKPETGIDYNVIPNCIFTRPEISSVGLTEKAAISKGYGVVSRKFLFSAIGKSHILGETDGFIKLVVDNSNDKVLGAQIIGHGAGELIAEIGICVQYGITSEKIAGVIHAHPTLSEVIQEVSQAVHGKGIHSI